MVLLKLKRLGLIAKLENKLAVQEAVKLAKFINSLDVEVVYEKNLARHVRLGRGVPMDQMLTDIIVTLGGDGTVLRTCMWIPNPETPILAINLGRRGFLTEVSPEEAEDAIKRSLSGDYVLEKHMKLSLHVNDLFTVDGLNEVLLTSTMPSKLLRFTVSLSNEELTRFSADGILISTPIGSTAHAFSAGGPVLHPSINAFNIVFICPLGPVKSIIVPSDEDITVSTIQEEDPLVVTVDGFYSKKIKPSDKITIKRSPHKACFVRFDRDHLKKSLYKLTLRDALIQGQNIK
ncbi:MAG: NAD(+)/NADH kinase [Candidatus Bathyarchaeia archaeon]